MYKHFIKRGLDIIFSAVALSILLFPMLIIALLIKTSSKGEIIFKQERLGRGGNVFIIYKFRTMVVGAEKEGVYSDDNDKRVTKIGKFLRKTSLDELPQLLNILKGDMSLVGPRPTLTYHPKKFTEYSEFELRRFTSRPGLTGLAQIEGRKTTPWDIRLKRDAFYADNLCFLLDTKIFFLTIKKVFSAEGNQNTAPTASSSLPPYSINNANHSQQQTENASEMQSSGESKNA